MSRLFLLLIWLAAGVSATAADLRDLAEALSREAEMLAEDAYRGFRNRSRGNRADVEALFMVEQFAASAVLLERMVEDDRPESELRDASSMLSSLAATAARYAFGQRQWRDIRQLLEDFDRELGRGSGRMPGSGRGISGRLRWRGQVDDVVHLRIQRDSVETEVRSGNAVREISRHFTSALPSRLVEVELRKLKGRGDVRLIQEPTRDNDFTAVVEIQDRKGGWAEYELELIWYQ